ncbi:MAG: SBBP repeat-containing protein [Bacteroidia bacterium]
MKKLFLFLFVALQFISTQAQTPNWLWAQKGEGNYNQNFGSHVATDSSGNSYVIGTFGGTVGQFGSFTLTGGGAASSDIFIAKYDSSGNCLWAERAGGAGWDLSYGGGIDIDVAGNCYVTGNFEQTAAFGTFSLTASGTAGTKNVFVAKYNSSGTCLWVRQGTSVQNGWSFGVSADNAGNCYIGGWWESSNGTGITFGALTLTPPGNPSDREIFIVKYDNSGNETWARRAGGPQTDECHHIDNDSAGNIYLTGTFRQTAFFGSISVTASGTFGDIFVAKYDANGNCIWVKQSFGGGINTSSSISTDKNGNSFITGNFTSDTLMLDSFSLPPYTGFNFYLAKYDVNGNVMWATVPPQTGSIQSGVDTHPDEAGGCYVAGNFMGSITFGATVLTCAGAASDEDNFIAKYDSPGNVQWVLQGTWANKSSQCGGISTDASGNVYLSGGFTDTVLFDTIQLTSVLSNGAMFIAKIGTPQPNSILENESNVNIAVYPVPAHDELYITTSAKGKAMVEITDIAGRLVKQEFIELEQNGNSISVRNIPGGIFLLRVAVNDNNKQLSYIRKIVIQ